MSLKCIIEEAKCCAVDKAVDFVYSSTYGLGDSKDSFYELLRFKSIIRTLERKCVCNVDVTPFLEFIKESCSNCNC